MTFEQHLQTELKRQEEQNHVRRTAAQTRRVLLPLEHTRAIQHQLREILLASNEQPVE